MGRGSRRQTLTEVMAPGRAADGFYLCDGGVRGPGCPLSAPLVRLNELRQRQAREILDLFSNYVAEGFYRRISLNTEHFVKARLLVALSQASMSAALMRLRLYEEVRAGRSGR